MTTYQHTMPLSENNRRRLVEATTQLERVKNEILVEMTGDDNPERRILLGFARKLGYGQGGGALANELSAHGLTTSIILGDVEGTASSVNKFIDPALIRVLLHGKILTQSEKRKLVERETHGLVGGDVAEQLTLGELEILNWLVNAYAEDLSRVRVAMGQAPADGDRLATAKSAIRKLERIHADNTPTK